MRKRWILVPLPPHPLPRLRFRFRFRFHKNVVILLVAIPPTNVEAADSADRFRFRFSNPGYIRVAVISEAVIKGEISIAKATRSCLFHAGNRYIR